MAFECKKLVIPPGTWDLSKLLEYKRVKSINIIGLVRMENAKKGALEYHTYHHKVDKPENVFTTLNKNKDVITNIYKTLFYPINFAEVDQTFFTDNNEFGFKCTFDTNTFVLDLARDNKKKEFVVLVAEFCLYDIKADIIMKGDKSMPLCKDRQNFYNVKLLHNNITHVSIPWLKNKKIVSGKIFIRKIVHDECYAYINDLIMSDDFTKISCDRKDNGMAKNVIITLDEPLSYTKTLNKEFYYTFRMIGGYSAADYKNAGVYGYQVRGHHGLIVANFIPTDGSINIKTTSDHVVGLILDLSELQVEDIDNDKDLESKTDNNCADLPLARANVNNKSSVISKEEKEMSKELFGKVYGSISDGIVAMDITGKLVIKPVGAKSYKRFDAKKGKMVDMLDHVFKLSGHLAYVLPVSIDTIEAGDIVLVSDKEFYFVKSINGAGVIKGINLNDSTMLEIVPESLAGSDISFVAKVINLLNPGKLDPMLMMMVLDNEGDATVDSKTAILMMMGMNNSGEGNNNMNMLLPMLLMDKSDGGFKDSILPIMMMNQSQGNSLDMNAILPLMLLSDDKEGVSNFKDLALMMMMNSNQAYSGCWINSNMLLPLMLMDKNAGKKDMLLMMAMMQKQTEQTLQLTDKQKAKEKKE